MRDQQPDGASAPRDAARRASHASAVASVEFASDSAPQQRRAPHDLAGRRIVITAQRKADEFAAQDDHIHVLHREGKGGLLGAYIAGFEWGLHRDYAVIVEMDADGSHAPEQLERHLAAIDAGADLVQIYSGFIYHGPQLIRDCLRQLAQD